MLRESNRQLHECCQQRWNDKTGGPFPLPVPERLKHQTEMLLVVEVPEEAKAVELVIRISVIQLLQEF